VVFALIACAAVVAVVVFLISLFRADLRPPASAGTTTSSTRSERRPLGDSRDKSYRIIS
jgi:hypothetical protein